MSQLHVLFRVGEAEYVVPAEDVLQMETFEGATPVPDAPPHVAGLVQMRGRVIPVIDLRVRFGLQPVARTLESRVVVVNRGARAVGLLVDSARDVLRIEVDTVQPLSDSMIDAGNRFVRGVIPGSRLLMVIDLDAVVGQESAHG